MLEVVGIGSDLTRYVVSLKPLDKDKSTKSKVIIPHALTMYSHLNVRTC